MIHLLPLMAQAAAAQVAGCSDPQTQQAMNQCAEQTFLEADRAMNAQWKETSAMMRAADRGRDGERPGSFELLLHAQRAWLELRDSHCQLEGYDVRGGSMESMVASLCRTDLTRKRTAQLRDLTIHQVSGESKSGDN